MAPHLNSLIWHILETYVYRQPQPPPQSATESLQQALIMLGYDHTYHGWDILFEEPHYIRGWVRLARKKWFDPGSPDGDCHISAAEFDELLGHCVAVTDAAASCFAAQMIEAYPDAKVILNVRRDLAAWQKSAVQMPVGVNESWTFWLLSWFSAERF